MRNLPHQWRTRLLFVVAVFLCSLPVLGAEQPEAATVEPLILEYEILGYKYSGMRQQVRVVEDGDFHLLSDIENGQLSGSGHVGRFKDGQVTISIEFHMEGYAGGSSRMLIEPQLRLGDFIGGFGSLPRGLGVKFLWIRRGIDPVPTLAETLRRRDSSSSFALKYLKQYRGDATQAIPALLEVATTEGPLATESKETPDSSIWLRENALSILGDMGPEARDVAPALVELLEPEQPSEVRAAAAMALWKIVRHPDAPAAIIDVLKHPEWTVRLEVLSALAEMGVETPFARSELLAMLDEDDLRVRAAAAWALWTTTRDQRAVKTLIGILQDNPGDAYARGQAGMALGRIGYPAAQHAVEALAAKALVPHGGNPSYVAEALPRVDPIGDGSLSLILGMLRKNEGRGLREASKVLAAYGSTIVPSLRELLDDEGPYARDLAFSILSEMGPAAVGTLADELEHPHAEVRRRAAELLRSGYRLPPAQAAAAVPALVRALDDEVDAVRHHASVALVEIGPAALPAVEQALDSDSPHVRQSAASIIRQIQAKQNE